MNYDPWDWVNQQKPVAPLGAQLQPSNEQPPPIQVVQDPTGQQLNQMAFGKGMDAATAGINAGIKAYGAPLSATTQAANTLGQGAALTNAGATAAAAPSSMYALTPTLTTAPLGGAGLGIGQGAASGIGAGLGSAAGTTAATTAATGAAGTGAATAGLGAAGVAGGEAALAAMGPVGWAIGAGLLAHKLGIF